jgi:molybdate transport system substrate-binding protein
MKKLIWAMVLFISAVGHSVHAQSLGLYAAAGVKSPIENILEIFSKQSGSHFDLHFDTAGAAQSQYLADPRAKILITTQERIEQSKLKGELKEGQMIPLAATVAGIASNLDPRPVIKTKEDLKALLLNVKSIAFSDPDRGATVGLHFVKVIRELGIEKEVLAKAKKAREGLQTMQWVKDAEVELGVTQVSEIVQAAPKTLVGPFPQEFDLSTRYALWIKEPDAPMMKSLIAWLKGPEARQLIASEGLRPLD